MYLRCPSAKMVSKASELFPEPDRPVMMTSLSRGISREMSLRLCSRAPRTLIVRASPREGVVEGAEGIGTAMVSAASAKTASAVVAGVSDLGEERRDRGATGMTPASTCGARPIHPEVAQAAISVSARASKVPSSANRARHRSAWA